MVLAAPAVALVGTAEADEAADINSRARLVVGAQRDPACRKLEAEIVHCPGARDRRKRARQPQFATRDRKSTRLNSSHVAISYAVLCLKKKKKKKTYTEPIHELQH